VVSIKPVSARRRCNGCEATARLSNQHARRVRYPELRREYVSNDGTAFLI
jgi:hypothetical protein